MKSELDQSYKQIQIHQNIISSLQKEIILLQNTIYTKDQSQSNIIESQLEIERSKLKELFTSQHQELSQSLLIQSTNLENRTKQLEKDEALNAEIRIELQLQNEELKKSLEESSRRAAKLRTSEDDLFEEVKELRNTKNQLKQAMETIDQMKKEKQILIETHSDIEKKHTLDSTRQLEEMRLELKQADVSMKNLSTDTLQPLQNQIRNLQKELEEIHHLNEKKTS